MSDVIQCPHCDKKFRLPERPPATFTCNQCGTLMDLSDFGGVDPAAPPAPPEPSGAPRSRRSRARGGRGAGAAAESPHPTRHRDGRPLPGGGARRRRGGRRRGAQRHPDEYDDEPRGRRGRPQKSNTAAIIGVAAVVVVIVVLIVAASNKGEIDEGDDRTAAIDGQPAGGLKTTRIKTTPGGGTAPGGTAPGGGEPVAGNPGGGEPTADGADGLSPDAKKRRKSGRYKRMSKVEFEIFEWPEEVDEETRAKVEECVKALYIGGRDATDAEEYLVGKGRPICGRLISEFKNISDSPGLDTKQGASMAGAIDAVLRKIDGWMERKWEELKPIRHSSHPNFTKRTAQRWTWWWKFDEWTVEPRKPWDPFEDESDESETGIKEPEVKKKKKGSGFSKRAGTGK